MLQNIGKPHQYRQRQAFFFKALRQLRKANTWLTVILIRVGNQVAVLIHIKIAFAPYGYVVNRTRLLKTPVCHCLSSKKLTAIV